MKYALLINEEFTLAAPCGTVAPILCQVKSGSVVLVAKPALGEPLEGAALDIIEDIVRKLVRDGIVFHTHGRNRRDGTIHRDSSPDRIDTVCIWYGFVPAWLIPMLPTSVSRYISTRKRTD
ncbi:MAG: hypothetical protein IT406_03820 [Candidatus Yanofskybacteria bacterium]|nr:hypothetical protein [Candidatus Yanofskybacteria bacterium]